MCGGDAAFLSNYCDHLFHTPPPNFHSHRTFTTVVDATGGVVSFDLDGHDPCHTGTFYLSAVDGTQLYLIVVENLRDLSTNPFNINCHLSET